MDLFFDGSDGLLRTLVSAPIIYASIIAFVRLTGKRSTSQMNNFDWIVTVALGSISASGIILENVTILEALLAVGLLLGLQWLLTKALLYSTWLRYLVKAEPKLLVHSGEYLVGAMREERVTRDEILAAVRAHGLTTVDDAQWIILENDATFSVIAKDESSKSTPLLRNVLNVPEKVREARRSSSGTLR